MDEEHTFAYCAGYIDGDGCFHIREQINKKTGNTKYCAKFILSSTNQNILYFFQSLFGGIVKMSSNKITSHKPQYHFVISANKFFKLKNIFPYLVEKKKEAFLIFRFLECEIKDEKAEIFKQIKDVKNNQYLVLTKHVNEFKQLSNSIEYSSLDLAYLSGFIDAECSLGISRNKSYERANFTYKIYLHCNNTKWPVFRWLMERFGGCLRLIKRNHKNPKHRDQLSWRISSKTLSKILPELLYNLKYKKPVCQELMNFYRTTLKNGGDRQSCEFKELYSSVLHDRNVIFNNVHLLNRKGV